MVSISWVADSPLWRMFSRFVFFALVGPESLFIKVKNCNLSQA